MLHNMFLGSMWLNWLFWIILISVIAGTVIHILNRSQKGSEHFPENDSPLDILNKRLARGDIDKEEYEQIRLRFK